MGTKLKNHSFSLMSSMSPYSSLTMDISESDRIFEIRISNHTMDEHTVQILHVNLYVHLFCQMYHGFRAMNTIWVGHSLPRPYGRKFHSKNVCKRIITVKHDVI